jgi:hypothetical protein
MKIVIRLVCFVLLLLFSLVCPSLKGGTLTVSNATNTDMALLTTQMVYGYNSGNYYEHYYYPKYYIKAYESLSVPMVYETGGTNQFSCQYYGLSGSLPEPQTYLGGAFIGNIAGDRNVVIMVTKSFYSTYITSWEVPAVATGDSGTFAPNSDEINTFKLGFWTVVGFGLFAVILSLLRRMGAQDHGPT